MKLTDKIEAAFTPEVLSGLFPREISDQFFEALFGDASEGAYDIFLVFKEYAAGTLQFELQTKQRPGKCLGCHLTYGLPQVFAKHPVIDIPGLVQKIDGVLDGQATVADWELGATREISRELYAIPLVIRVTD